MWSWLKSTWPGNFATPHNHQHTHEHGNGRATTEEAATNTAAAAAAAATAAAIENAAPAPAVPTQPTHENNATQTHQQHTHQAAKSQQVDSDGLRPASESPDGGFWGFHTNEVSVESDPALDDMMAFFGFAHKEKTSEYVGCVSFELTYPDGRTSIKTVNVRPKSDHDNSIRIEEVKSDDPPKSARVEPIPSSVSPHGWLTPVRRLVVPLRPSADSSLSSACDAAPRLPFSSRIDIFTGPLPAHVKPTARLLCPRSIFFDVYLGRLDPMTSVLTGKAHCPGWRYYELLHFGQCFEMKPETWTSFYAAQKIVQDGNKAITDGKNE